MLKSSYLRFNLISIFFVLIYGCETTNQPTGSISQLEFKIDSVLANMTLEEKIGQMSQRGTSSRVREKPSEELKEAIRQGKVGSMINVMFPDDVEELQKIAVEESPSGIPLLFARDVIHGFKTIFPIPLGQAAAFNTELAKEGSRIAAREATTSGIRWTFAPMIDISRDARWGRIAESAGEDPYLSELMARAYVEGFQGDDLSNRYSMAACAKHFAGYGAVEGGRDYNTAMISDEELHNTYLRPFAAVVDAGAATFMTSFNDLNGVPASGNKFLLKEMLRDTWGFDGFVVSDWNSMTEMINHGYCKDENEVAEKSANAGLDMEMMSQAYENKIKGLITEGRVDERQIDFLVRNILRIKFRLGLFDDTSFDKDRSALYAEAHLESAKQAAIESAVLLKNEEKVLPLSKNIRKMAVIGPMADAPLDQLGTWIFDGEKERSVTPLTALKQSLGHDKILYAPGLEISRDRSTKGFLKASKIAAASDVILFFAGEEAILSGEAHSRANIDLPGAQEELIKKLALTGKPIVLVVMAGRPITIGNIMDDVDAVLMAWHPGTMGGPALVDLIMGKVSPSGRLPVTWPKTVGQIPMHYNHKNTGRPAKPESFVHMDDIPVGAWQSSLGNESHYLDEGYEPMFPFGFGLTYSKVEYSNMEITSDELAMGEMMTVSVEVNNIGNADVKEVVQLYFQDRFASLTRPVKELLRFKKVDLKAGESKTVEFQFSTDDLAFWTANEKWETEKGDFNLWIAPNAASGIKKEFVVN